MASLKFGLFEFDTETTVLRRAGRPVRLQRQPARMLASLLAQPGEIVTRETLQQAIWDEGTHVDFERGLNFCAAQIRSALGDSAAQPRFIETIPKQGYRFIAPVEPAERGAGPAEAPVVFHDRRGVPRWIVAAAAGMLLLAAAVGWAFYRTAGGDEALPTVAVVPFENETGSPELTAVAKGISDATVARLATPERLPRLRVIGNASALRFTFARRDLQAMGASLGAEFIVLGQLKRDARGLRVVAHLIRVSDQTHVWAETFDRAVVDLPAQIELAEAIARAVDARAGLPAAPHARP